MVVAELVAWILEQFGMGTLAVTTISAIIVGLAIISHLTTAGTFMSHGVGYAKITLGIILVMVLLGLLDTQQLAEYIEVLRGVNWMDLLKSYA